VKQSKSLEEAAQALATALHTQFQESVVLARVYFTVPFGAFPATNKAFVQKLAESAEAASDLKATTPVLSLIGTAGQEVDWNDRRKSKNHVGIPLTSSAFVDAIPMISRLLKELGVPLDWVDTQDAEVIKKMDRAAGLFFVENAAEATDHQGRKIIPAQDFVSGYNLKSVFGVGGGYAGGQMLVIVLFCRDLIPRAAAERFVALRDAFKGNTSSFVESAKVFSSA
jgi:histone H3/H4